MVSRKQAIIIEMVEFILYVWAQWIYTLFEFDDTVIRNVFICSLLTTIIASVCLVCIKNEMVSQIGFIICIMIATNLIGAQMGTLLFALCVYMISGALVSIIGNQKLNVLHIIISNISIIYGLLFNSDIIFSVITVEGYFIMVMFCEVFLITENYVVMLYQQKVKEIEKQNELLNIAKESKDEFLANMSHEIRTPMNVIIGMTELIMREKQISKKVKEYCSSIQSSGENLIAIINDILDFSKIESGKLDIIEEPYSIASVVQDIANTTMFRRGFKDIEIIIDCNPNIPKQLVGDVVRIRQILLNIAVNAIKYTEIGYIYISLYCYKQDGMNWLHMEVKDSGIGIKQEDLEHLFESFNRVDTTRNRSIEGTGLGLALCKRLTEAMHGEIQLESEYGVGTIVRVDIPQEIADEGSFLKVQHAEDIKVVMYGDRDQYKQKAYDHYRIANEHTWEGLNVSYRAILDFVDLINAVENKEVTHIYTGVQEYTDQRNYFDSIAKKIKVFVMYDAQYPVKLGAGIYGVHMPFYSVNLASSLNGEAFYNQYIDKSESKITFKAPSVKALIVDDNDINLKVAEGVLKLYNVTCVLARSGKEAIEILKNQDMDIVFMDHMMPEMDGIEATRIIRRVGGEYGKSLPIIALTANAVNDAKKLFLDNGFQDFIAKPISIKRIDSVLRRWIPGTKIELVDETSAKQIPEFEEETFWYEERLSENEELLTLEEFLDEWDEDNRTLDEFQNMIGEGFHMPEQIDDAVDETFIPMEVNEEKALENMGGQRDLYKELLEYCMDSEEQRRQEIVESFENQNWEEYTIRVHALKGSMRSLGIEELALIAQGQEFACKEGRIEDAIAGHPHLLEEYERGQRTIEAYLKDFQV